MGMSPKARIKNAKGEDLIRREIKCLNSCHKLQKLFNEWPKELVKVFGFVWTGNNANTQNVTDPETNLWSQVVVIDQDQPAGFFVLPKWAKLVL